MARKRINFDNLDIEQNTSIKDHVDKDTEKVVVTNSDGQISVVKKENFDQNMNDIIEVTPIQTDLEDGANIIEKYLNKEYPLMKEYFFDDFGRNPIAEYDDTGGWIRILNFPLPDYVDVDGKRYVYPIDSEDIVIVIDNYPEMPPIGFHIKESSPNVALFHKLFKTHLFDEIKIGSEQYQEEVKALSDKGLVWICFHYQNNKWNFNRNNVKQGDALFKYFHWLFAKFSGVDIAG